MRGWVVFLWAVLATIVLVTVGIFGTLIVSGRIVLFPVATAAPTPAATVAPVVDTSYSVIVLNATPVEGLATQTKDLIVEAGWAEEAVTASGAGVTDFAETTVYTRSPRTRPQRGASPRRCSAARTSPRATSTSRRTIPPRPTSTRAWRSSWSSSWAWTARAAPRVPPPLPDHSWARVFQPG